MNKVVKRLVFLMLSYAVITALTYIPICALQQHSKLLEYYTTQYFGCLMFFPPDHCPRSKYRVQQNCGLSHDTLSQFSVVQFFFLII